MNKIFKNIKGRKILIALVGLGRISKKHVTALAKLNSRAEIVAICDPVEELISQSETFIKEEHDKNGNKHVKTIPTPSNLLFNRQIRQPTPPQITYTTMPNFSKSLFNPRFL